MKKFLTFLFAFLTSIGLMNAETFTFGKATDPGKDKAMELEAFTMISGYFAGGTSKVKVYNSDTGIKVRTSKKSSDGKENTLELAVKENIKITELKMGVVTNNASNSNAISAVYVDGVKVESLTYPIATPTTKTAKGDAIFTLTGISATKNICISFDGTTQVFIAGEGTYENTTSGESSDDDTRPAANISWSTENTSLKIGDAFTDPVFNNPDNLPVTFSSSDEKLATVSLDGTISLIEGITGTATISATYDGGADASYKPTTVTTTIEVKTNVKDVYAWDTYPQVESIPLTQLITFDDKTSGYLDPGTLKDDDIIKIETVYKAKYVNQNKEYLSKNFTGALQAGRVDVAPSDDNLNGTEKSDNSPLIVTPKKDCKVVMFVRRQGLEQSVSEDNDVANNIITKTHHIGMSPNDGKSVYASPHSAINTRLGQKLVFGAYFNDPATGNNDFMACAIEWDLKAGETYTLWTRGTTIAMHGIGYYVEKKIVQLSTPVITYDATNGTITISSDENAKKVVYTTDGSEPSETSTVYTAPFTVAEGTVVKAMAIGNGDTLTNSNVAEAKAVVPIVCMNWDFTKWSDATVANLKAGSNWSDIEKVDATAPTEASKDNCFWQVKSSDDLSPDKYVQANSVVIEELKGLVYTNTTDRSLAIAVNYPTALNTYNGGSYLWLGSSKKNYFKIPNVPAGATIKMGVESHKFLDARGVELSINGEKLKAPDGSAVAVPTTYTEQEWLVPADAAEMNDVQIYNTNGCHIYFINVTVPDERIMLNDKEITMDIDSERKIGYIVYSNNETVTWTSSDENVATVENGVVTAVAAGKATITATTFKGKSATCTVTVEVEGYNQKAYEAVINQIEAVETEYETALAKVKEDYPKYNTAEMEEIIGGEIAQQKGWAAQALDSANDDQAKYTFAFDSETIDGMIGAMQLYAANDDAHRTALAEIEDVEDDYTEAVQAIEAFVPGFDPAEYGIKTKIDQAKQDAETALATANEEFENYDDVYSFDAEPIKASITAMKNANRGAYNEGMYNNVTADIEAVEEEYNDAVDQIMLCMPAFDLTEWKEIIGDKLAEEMSGADQELAAATEDSRLFNFPFDEEYYEGMISEMKKDANQFAYDAVIGKLNALENDYNASVAEIKALEPDFDFTEWDILDPIEEVRQEAEKEYNAASENGTLFDFAFTGEKIESALNDMKRVGYTDVNQRPYKQTLAVINVLLADYQDALYDIEDINPDFDSKPWASKIEKPLEKAKEDAKKTFEEANENFQIFSFPVDADAYEALIAEMKASAGISGIEGIEAEVAAGKAKIFTLDGKSHNAPVKGQVNVIVRGSSVVKTMINK